VTGGAALPQKVTPVESKVEATGRKGQVSPRVSTAPGPPLLFREGSTHAKNSLQVAGCQTSGGCFRRGSFVLLKVEFDKLRDHSLTGRITPGLMRKAFKSVRRNRGTAGIDKQSIAMFESNLEENLAALMREIKDGSFPPLPLRRVYIPKRGGFLPFWPILSSISSAGVWMRWATASSATRAISWYSASPGIRRKRRLLR
jgi:hypothetical protein